MLYFGIRFRWWWSRSWVCDDHACSVGPSPCAIEPAVVRITSLKEKATMSSRSLFSCCLTCLQGTGSRTPLSFGTAVVGPSSSVDSQAASVTPFRPRETLLCTLTLLGHGEGVKLPMPVWVKLTTFSWKIYGGDDSGRRPHSGASALHVTLSGQLAVAMILYQTKEHYRVWPWWATVFRALLLSPYPTSKGNFVWYGRCLTPDTEASYVLQVQLAYMHVLACCFCRRGELVHHPSLITLRSPPPLTRLLGQVWRHGPGAGCIESEGSLDFG